MKVTALYKIKYAVNIKILTIFSAEDCTTCSAATAAVRLINSVNGTSSLCTSMGTLYIFRTVLVSNASVSAKSVNLIKNIK